MNAVVRYTLLRSGLFLAAAALLWLVGARGLLLLALALLSSGVLSLVMLSRQRDDMSAALLSSRERLRREVDSRARAEDRD